MTPLALSLPVSFSSFFKTTFNATIIDQQLVLTLQKSKLKSSNLAPVFRLAKSTRAWKDQSAKKPAIVLEDGIVLLAILLFIILVTMLLKS